MNDLLIISRGNFNQHLTHLNGVLTRLNESGLKVNVGKSFFGRTQIEYLGYWITRDGVKSLNKKVKAINNLAPPTNHKGVQWFIGLVNYYRDMWQGRSEILAPLTKLTSTSQKWRCSDEEQNAFETMKIIMARETILAYPNFKIPFEIHKDASAFQLGKIISKKR